MVNLPYLSLSNVGPGIFAFDVSYMSGGTPVYGYSKPINPGNTVTIQLASDASSIVFKGYVLNPPYQLITIYKTTFSTPPQNCYLSSGTYANPAFNRIPCFLGDTPNNNCCCCCCCK